MSRSVIVEARYLPRQKEEEKKYERKAPRERNNSGREGKSNSETVSNNRSGTPDTEIREKTGSENILALSNSTIERFTTVAIITAARTLEFQTTRLVFHGERAGNVPREYERYHFSTPRGVCEHREPMARTVAGIIRRMIGLRGN